MNARQIIEAEDLPMDFKSRMARARALGFNVPAFHGTTQKFNEFSMEAGKPHMLSGYAPHFAAFDKAEAKGYADRRGTETGQKGRVMSVLLRMRKAFTVPKYPQKLRPELFAQISDESERAAPGSYTKGGTGTLHDIVHDIGGMLWKQACGNRKTADMSDAEIAALPPWPHKEAWDEAYRRLRAHGYDAVVFDGVPADFGDGDYSKVTILDMSGIRLKSAKFDPARSHERDIRA